MGIGGVTEIRGVAHPAPSKFGRGNRAALSRAEIQSTNLAGKPLLNEHSSDERVGTVLTSWEGRDGSLRIAAHVEDPTAQQQVRDGTLRGLSLGTDMILATDGSVAYRSQAELSICAEVSTKPNQPTQPNQRKPTNPTKPAQSGSAAHGCRVFFATGQAAGNLGGHGGQSGRTRRRDIFIKTKECPLTS